MTGGPALGEANIVYDNVGRFSLAGAEHGFLGWDSAVGIRAGERKTGWTKPLPRTSGLWALNGPRYLLAVEIHVRAVGWAQTVLPTEPLRD
jgi:hypothetical protein